MYFSNNVSQIKIIQHVILGKKMSKVKHVFKWALNEDPYSDYNCLIYDKVQWPRYHTNNEGRDA